MKLIIFDVDGTLVDSQGDILAAMQGSFDGVGMPVPDRKSVLSIVGLSLPQAMMQLAPDVDAATRDGLVEGYKESYVRLRAENGVAQSSPLYPGIRSTLDALLAQEGVLLGVATGKSRKGLDKLLDGHGLRRHFATEQCADFHPSKPHPSMLLTAMADLDVAPSETVMIGDTTFDIDMAHAAGCRSIAVGWGYHDRSALAGADALIDEIAELDGVIERFREQAQ